MNRLISEKIDNLFNEILRLKEDQAAGTHFTPRTIENYKQRLTELYVRECEIALSPMLRDMISRGTAVDCIKYHFGIDTRK